MAKKWGIKDIEKQLEIISKKCKDETINLIPVRISNRMTKCKGQFKGIRKFGVLYPKEFVFASCLLDGRYPTKVVKEVIIHEVCHYLANKKFGANQFHNSNFKMVCNELGIKGDTYFNHKPINN